MKKIVEPVPASISITDIYFDKISYDYDPEKDDHKGNYKMNFTREVAVDNNPYGVRLTCNVFDDCGSTHLSVRIVSFFKCNLEDKKEVEDILKINAVAIIFPYLRSQIALITTQPNRKPIILDAMNIVKMFEEAEDTKLPE